MAETTVPHWMIGAAVALFATAVAAAPMGEATNKVTTMGGRERTFTEYVPKTLKPGAKVGEGDVRLRSMVATLHYGIQRGWKQIIFGHTGRKPEGSLKAVAGRLGELLGKPVPLVADWWDEATQSVTASAAAADTTKMTPQDLRRCRFPFAALGRISLRVLPSESVTAHLFGLTAAAGRNTRWFSSIHPAAALWAPMRAASWPS